MISSFPLKQFTFHFTSVVKNTVTNSLSVDESVPFILPKQWTPELRLSHLCTHNTSQRNYKTISRQNSHLFLKTHLENTFGNIQFCSPQEWKEKMFFLATAAKQIHMDGLKSHCQSCVTNALYSKCQFFLFCWRFLQKVQKSIHRVVAVLSVVLW